MNDFFQLFKFTEKFKVKKKYINDDYISLKVIIKWYYKKILAENLDIDKTSYKALSRKTQEFWKGNWIKFVKGKSKIERF